MSGAARKALHDVGVDNRLGDDQRRHEIEIAPWGLIAGTVTAQTFVAGFGAQQLDAIQVDFDTQTHRAWAMAMLFAVTASTVAGIVFSVRRRWKSSGGVSRRLSAGLIQRASIRLVRLRSLNRAYP